MNNIIYIGGNKKMLTELTNQNYNELISADKPLVIDFLLTYLCTL